MITPDDVPRLAIKTYRHMLSCWVHGKPYIPQHWRVGPIPSDMIERHAVCVALAHSAKTPGGVGYSVQWQQRHTRTKIDYTVPQTVYAETLEDLLALAGKEAEFAHFQSDVTLIRAYLPALERWIQVNPQRVVAYAGEWEQLLNVVTYLQEHPWPAIEIRTLPVAVDTKFIEHHTGILSDLLNDILPPEAINADASDFARRYGFTVAPVLVRIRALDHQFDQHYHFPSEDITMPLADAYGLHLDAHVAIIVENLHAFLALPAVDHAIALWGAGFAARGIVTLPWLKMMRVLYWGDIDAQGFEILSQVRALLPHVESFLMEESLLSTLSDFTVTGTPTLVKSLSHLTEVEKITHLRLVQSTLRLEQERIPHAYLCQMLRNAITYKN